MKRDLIRKILHENILKKTANKSQELQVSLSDVVDHAGYPLIDLETLPDLIDDLEKSTNGKIRLLNPLAIEIPDSIDDFSRDNNTISPFCYYYRVFFDPDYKHKKEEKIKMNVNKFFLSKNIGLYRYLLNGEMEKYKLKPDSVRYKIFSNLRGTYKTSDALASNVGYSDPQKLRGQIIGIRKMISKRFKGMEGEDFIEGEQGRGYRLKENIRLEEKQK